MNRLTEEQFQTAATLISKLDSLRKSGTIEFDNKDQLVSLKNIYTTIYGTVKMDLNCSSCVFHYLHMIEAYYHREFPKHQASIPNDLVDASTEVVIEPVDMVTDDVQEPVLPAKPKRKRKPVKK